MSRFVENSLGRQLALQFLFSLEFMETPWEQALVEFWRMDPAALNRGACDKDERFVIPQARFKTAHLEGARRYAEKLIAGVCAYGADMDEHVAMVLDNWKPERVGRIEWVILRLALYEMRYCPDTPDAVVIAEATQLASTFGEEDAPRFVNGLLNRLATGKEAPPESPE